MTNRAFKTGTCREQASLLPPRIEDYVGRDNPVRVIETFACGLDLVELGFLHAEYNGGSGQPPYDPTDLLKLYLYGYLNRVRSSRRLARETDRNLEVIWLLKALRPGYRTIANFRRDNGEALKAANRKFVVLMRELGLVSAELVAIDGAFFHGDASKTSIKSRKRLEAELVAIERDIEAYHREIEANDAQEEAHSSSDNGGGRDGGDLVEKATALMEKRTRTLIDLNRLEKTGETQLSRTDADARLLSKSGQRVSGYNVQIGVDEKHKLIVASEVVNDGNDTGQLYEMAKAAKEALEIETLEVVADAGYFNGPALKQCEDNGIIAYVPQPTRTERLEAQDRFTHEDFAYDAAQNAYRCPAGTLLLPTKTPKINGSRRDIVHLSRKAACDACALRTRCLSPKADTRTIYRWEHQDVIDRHLERMKHAADRMRQRKCLVEHPFGTLKCRAGYRHFLVRGFDKVRGEWSLMALCYNFARVLTILGFEGLMTVFSRRAAERAILLIASAMIAAMDCIRASMMPPAARSAQKSAPCRLCARSAT
jgi:transposase